MRGELLGKLCPVIAPAGELSVDGILDSHHFKTDGTRSVSEAREEPLGGFFRYFGSGRESDLEFYEGVVIVVRFGIGLAFFDERRGLWRRGASSENGVNERTECGGFACIIHRRSRLSVMVEERAE